MLGSIYRRESTLLPPMHYHRLPPSAVMSPLNTQHTTTSKVQNAFLTCLLRLACSNSLAVHRESIVLAGLLLHGCLCDVTSTYLHSCFNTITHKREKERGGLVLRTCCDLFCHSSSMCCKQKVMPAPLGQ